LEGRNIHIDYRFSVDTVELGEVRGKELMALQPELILAHGTPAVAALRNLTRTVPVVFVVVSEPVAQGFVQSLSHPSGNITGLSYLEASLGAKWLELLKELAPQVVRVATIYNPDCAERRVFLAFCADRRPEICGGADRESGPGSRGH
jgi:putative tryptophan/tyrosine transport system substrate-binding protein